MSSPQNGRLVLYAEDEEADRMFMEIAFRKAGLARALRTVNDGLQAKDYLAGSGAYADRSQHPPPTLLLLDLNMPMLGGFEVLAWMKTEPELTSLPVIIFTSSAREEDRARAMTLGVSGYMEKPLTMEGFGQVVQKVREQWLANGEQR